MNYTIPQEFRLPWLLFLLMYIPFLYWFIIRDGYRKFKWLREIHEVGFYNWVWFVLYLKRNEFHPSLDRIKIVDGRYLLEERQGRRQLAHKIALKFEELK
jgi:hypothetical protein